MISAVRIILAILFVSVCINEISSVNAQSPSPVASPNASPETSPDASQAPPSPSPTTVEKPLKTVFSSQTFSTLYGITLCGTTLENILVVERQRSIVQVNLATGAITEWKDIFNPSHSSSAPIGCAPDGDTVLYGAGRSLVRRKLTISAPNETLPLVGSVQSIAVSRKRNKAYVGVLDAPYGVYEIDLERWTAAPMFAVPSTNQKNVSICTDISLTPDETRLYAAGDKLYEHVFATNSTTIYQNTVQASIMGFAYSNTARFDFRNDVFYKSGLPPATDREPQYEAKGMITGSGCGLYDAQRDQYCISWLETGANPSTFQVVCLDLTRTPDMPSPSPAPPSPSPSPSPSPAIGVSPQVSPSPTTNPIRPGEEPGFFTKNKWAVPTFIVVGLGVLVAIGYSLTRMNKRSTLDTQSLIDDHHAHPHQQA